MNIPFVLKTRPALLKVLYDMVITHVNKDHDYAESEPLGNLKYSAELGIEPWLGTICRMGDKYNRIQSLTSKDVNKVDEKISDTILDLAIYSLLCDILLSQQMAIRTNDPIPFNTYETEAERYIDLVGFVAYQVENVLRDGTGFDTIEEAWKKMIGSAKYEDGEEYYEYVHHYLLHLSSMCVVELIK